ncbi:TPA: hypothetical protein DCP77_04150 [Candidatus Collierbacteria bacterium]|uniref:Uncharacterized protein n=1 Tax=Candidatus Collierbacteria bacterium GW2011_GWA2_42_17 TaxID=1618378 RepID=A0A0G0Z3A3_9BACT|nr:MAG: hypothetical protein UU94_C0008G0034 [Candidatus Collierbacteria bacterium GW2011_GWB2_42_12]KKS43239.1 MAG: hypothetical protein UV06_C0002G0141 [Candidatus Collierbacteria bacterium GW2011_GWA2_42_17]KKS62205.1 MAG: hypothetical protein UV28_C0015G0002 [Candidatus Collierbacteria bacterium GW2011_GWE2_42_48]KKS66975.1 MAG: hypothetical protein UV37_C0013G0009 [Candidatus Collierbacteria bacterium GW2011_GWA1_42_60]HAI22768.1 hypothetical protein [Candidatus Collierbacteria bacterium]
MRKEYDLAHELGPQNWLDVVAGEAVVLGWFLKDAELTMRGTMLAEGIAKVHFDDDSFFKVEAQALDLVKTIEERKKDQTQVQFLDEICEYDGKNKSLNKWEYSLILSGGGYQIMMLMPEYFDREPPDDGKSRVEEIIWESFKDPAFGELVKVEDSKMMGVQKMDTTDYYTHDKKLVCHKVDFDHECKRKRGQIIIYHINDYAQSITVWTKIRATLGQRK